MTLQIDAPPNVEATMSEHSIMHNLAMAIAILTFSGITVAGILQISGWHHYASLLAIVSAMLGTIAGTLTTIDLIKYHKSSN